MPFHELAQHLSHKSTIKDLKKIGMVIVRDVIADADAQAVGEEVRAYTQARSGHCESPPYHTGMGCEADEIASYWHQLLLALRASPSVLSANSQVMAALMGKETKYIRVDTLGSIASEAQAQSMNLSKPWSVSIVILFAIAPPQTPTLQQYYNVIQG